MCSMTRVKIILETAAAYLVGYKWRLDLCGEAGNMVMKLSFMKIWEGLAA